MSSKGIEILRKYEEDYWEKVTMARQSLPEGALPDFLASVKQVVIYDCPDGYLILRYREQTEKEFIVTHDSPVKWQQLLHEQKMYDQYGKESTLRVTFELKNPDKYMGLFISIRPEARKVGNLELCPKYLSAAVVVGEPGDALSDGTKAAEADISQV